MFRVNPPSVGSFGSPSDQSARKQRAIANQSVLAVNQSVERFTATIDSTTSIHGGEKKKNVRCDAKTPPTGCPTRLTRSVRTALRSTTVVRL